MPSPSPEQVQHLFNRIAPIYDLLNDRLSLGQHRLWKKMLRALAQPQPGERWLDVCCGSGDVAALLAQRVGDGGQVVGLDGATAMLAIARQKYASRANIFWQEGDALALPYDIGAFAGVTMAYGLRNVGNIPLALGEMYRVLRPGGTAIALDFHRPDNPWLSQIQELYLERVVVPAAEQWQRGDEYRYIMPSLARFPNGREQECLAREVGFDARHYPIAGGMMGILLLYKKNDG